jgi:putative oxidoreductase
MAVDYFVVHALASCPAKNGGDPAYLFRFGFLYIVCDGPGPISLDHWLKRRSRKAESF